MLQTAAMYLLPADLPLHAPNELNGIIEAASICLGSMQSAKTSPGSRSLGVHYYQAAFRVCEILAEYGNFVFSGVEVAGYDMKHKNTDRTHSVKSWLLPTAGATAGGNVRSKYLDESAGRDGKLTMILSSGGCSVYDVERVNTGGPVSSFQWNEMIHVKIVGAWTNIDIHLGDVRGRLVIHCFSAGWRLRSSKVCKIMHMPFYEEEREQTKSASVSPSWFKLSFGELPLAPVPLSLERVLTQDSSTRVDGLVSIVLREARIRNFVYAEVVSDIGKFALVS